MDEEYYFGVLILVGASHSGKTYYAQSRIKGNPRMIRVNRDDLRNMLSLGQYDSLTEDIIKQTQFNIIQTALRAGYSVIVDNTHLGAKDLFEYASRFGLRCGVLFFDSSQSMERAKTTGRMSLSVYERVIPNQIEKMETMYPKEKFMRNKMFPIHEVLFGERNE